MSDMQKVRMECTGLPPRNALLANFLLPPDVLIWKGRVLLYQGTKKVNGETLHTWKQAQSVIHIDPQDTDFFNVTT